MREWYENFNKYYMDIHAPLLTKEINESEVNFLEHVLKLEKGASILDLPCGYGRHSNILAERGYKVTGIDIKEEFLDIAKSNSIDSSNPSFLQGDMRNIPFENEFDAILNLFTSFGYYSDEENFKTLESFSKALKMGGKLVIDILNREWSLKQTKDSPLVWILYDDNKVFMAKNKYNIFSGRWRSDQIITDHGQAHTQFQDIRLYTYTELSNMLNKVGMVILSSYGNINTGEPYSINSRNMIVVAEKVL